ncbi:hypothetical protein LTR94_026450, partial [Friedmanniomyces endolithicus]
MLTQKVALMHMRTHGLRRVQNITRRHKAPIADFGLIAITLAIATLFVFEVDVIYVQRHADLRRDEIELDELVILTSLLLGGVLFYVWRRAGAYRRETSQRRKAEQDLLVLALQDPLTGLPNRRRFDEALRSALESPPTAPEAHAVFVMDLNGFKSINDVYGHPAGDQALIHVGARLLRAVRDGDLVARLGGDEFGLVARNVAGADAAAAIGARILECLDNPVTVDGVRHKVGAAIGAALSPQDGARADELVRKADVALYRVKAERRSSMRFFEEEMDRRLHERDTLKKALLSDLGTDRFEVRFQPRVSTSGEIDAFEAKLLWKRDEEIIEPERFWSIASDADALAALCRSLLVKACQPTLDWPRSVRLAFPLPSDLVAHPSFGLTVLSVLAETGLSPSRLELEIDEGALIRDVDAALALLTPLRRLGIGVIAARFGTGYSDLHGFRRLNLDGVKIDKSFIEVMTKDRGAALMIKALIGVGQGLEMAVIADG